MFKRHYQKKSTNPLFVIFRLFLSLVMFTVLLAGVYTAYKHFSGLDPLKLDPQAVISNIVGDETYQRFFSFLSATKLTKILPDEVSKKILGQSATVENYVNTNNSSESLFKFLLVADTHNDNDNLKKAITQAKQAYPDLQFIIGLGDYTDVGTIEELKKAKNEFDLSNLRYFLLVGDHDLWDARDKGMVANTNFREVFGLSYQSFTYKNFRFLLLNNADNYLGIENDQQKKIRVYLSLYMNPCFIPLQNM
ncbi:metallophosphoesterase [Candidatus Daviesbacteria bacterium]|nr:metallophosphoesterase [Candidatus Daviesbacteria bacterium]